MFKSRGLMLILFCLYAAIFGKVHAVNDNISQEKVDVDAREIVFGHIGDSYEWHITSWGDYELTIPLPVIVHSNTTGWNVFASTNLFPEGKVYKGFKIATEGEYEGKIVQVTDNEGVIRPFDISITKNVLALLINSAILVCCILFTSRWYKKRTPESDAPKGFVGFMEMFVIWVEDDIVKECVGKDYKKYSPYLLTAFFFILVNNLMGLIPVFPGGANVTGNIAITLVLALCTFIAINLWGNKEYWKDIFWPHVPIWLKLPVPLMPVVELFGVFTKPFALMIRLFANIMAGHSVILALTSLIFVTVSMGPALNGTMTVVSVIFCIFMDLVELLVAFIQAYVFTMLSAVFIGLSRMSSEKPEKAH